MTDPATDPLPTAAGLLNRLEATGPHPVLAWYGESARIELSGHVLANWVIKSIGHLNDEIMLDAGDDVVLDLPDHWKRLVLALAAWSLGAEVDHRDGTGNDTGAAAAAPRVVATDRPDSDLAEAADEVLALAPVSLAPRFDGQLPPLAHDWAQEVRASSDQLGIPLPAWNGPAPRPPGGSAGQATADGSAAGEAAAVGAAADGATADGAAADGDALDGSAAGSAAGRPLLLVDGDGMEVIDQVIGVFLAGGGIVGPAAEVSEQQARDEGVTARA